MSTAITSYPFDSQSVAEAQWSAMAKFFLGSGVLRHELNELQAYGDSSGMQVKVKTGRAFVQGVFGENPSEATLAIAAAHATLSRIDRVVLEIQWDNNQTVLDVVTGTAAGTPAAPALTRSGTRWQVSLAQVLVDPAAVTIAVGKVTDERADQSVCGYAAHAFPCVNVLSTAKPASWPVGGLIYLTDTSLVQVNSGTYAAPSWATVYPLQFDATVPVTQAFGDAAAAGSAATPAHRDHRHGMPKVTIVRKSADESVTSSIALQNDDELFFSVAANENWTGYVMLLTNGSTAGDIKVGFNLPAAGAILVTVVAPSLLVAAPGWTPSVQVGSVGGTSVAVGTSGSADTAVLIFFDYLAGGTAGTLRVHWAQNVADATPTKVLAGSRLVAFQG